MLEHAGELGVHGARLIRDEANQLFAEFALRAVGVFVDSIVVMFIVTAVTDHILVPLGIAVPSQWILLPVALIIYYGLSWASPMNASPAQLLLGMRVYDEHGLPLSSRNAWLRAVLLTAVLLSVAALLTFIDDRELKLLGLLPLLLLLVALVTPHRQAVHDLVARSLVINKRAIKTDLQRDRMIEFLQTGDSAIRKMRRPLPTRMAADILAVMIPVVLITIGIQANQDKQLRGRVVYAISQTGYMQAAIAEYRLASGDWPRNAEELAMDTRIDYPDGGYHELQANGEILIVFSVLPELSGGTLVMTPVEAGGAYNWQCRPAGSINSAYLPAYCRD